MGIGEIIIKKLNGQLSESENEIFLEWLESSSENKELFKRLEITKSKTTIPAIDHLDAAAAFDTILLSAKSKRKKGLIFSVMKYASIAIIFIMAGFSTWYYLRPDVPKEIIDPYAVTLDMENGKTLSLSTLKQQNILDESGNFIGSSTQKEIDYRKAAKQNEAGYNCLKVPNGKTYNVRLSDGTLVHMNAGSSLKFPVTFFAENFRKVTLTGEAFFEVSKDKKHPFIIRVNSLDITVLGTKFNVNSYPEDISIKTVLVEGSVKLAEKGTKPQFLTPGYEADWNPNSKKIKFSKVDTSIATRWMEKGLVINELPFDKVIIKLERYYGITIENRNKSMEGEMYTAKFSTESIEEVLNALQYNTEFKYKITNKHIIIY